MMGKRSAQDKLFAADHVYLDFVGRDTLYGYMAQNREQLFRDEDFAALYCPDNGRQSVPPSLAVSLLFLRAYEGVSFAEAVERTKYDLRWKVALGLWKVALGLEMEEVPMQKSALQEFEAKLVLHEMEEPILQKSIAEARRAGYLKSGKIRVALDTTPILGKGAVKDTYNLLGKDALQRCSLYPLSIAAPAWLPAHVQRPMQGRRNDSDQDCSRAREPCPTYFVACNLSVQLPPKVLVEHDLPHGGFPSVALPARQALRYSPQQVFRIRDHLDFACLFQRCQAFDRCLQFHAVGRRVRVATNQFTLKFVRAQNAGPAAGARIADA